MKNTIILLLSCVTFVAQAQWTIPQPKEVTEAYYPDPDLEIPTPAFDGDSDFTDYEEMMEFLNGLLENHPSKMNLQYIGESQRGVRIPMVTLSAYPEGTEPLRVWMQGGLHGDEPGSTEGMLYLLHEMLNNPDYAYLLERLEIAIVPMANIDGYVRQIRDSDNGLDLNRDQTKLMAPESVALKRAFHTFSPHVAVDFHEYRPHRRDFQNFGHFGVNGSYDVMFLYSGNLNVPAELRNYTREQFVTPATEVLDQQNLTHHDYFSTGDIFGGVVFNQGSLNSRSSATNYALSNVISTLIEIRGVGLGRTSFKRRVHSALLVAMSYLETAYENHEEVREVLKASEEAQPDAVLDVERPLEEASYDVIDNATRERVAINVVRRDAWKARPTLSRERPAAYVLDSSQTHLAEKLRILGLEVQELSESVSMEVQTYTVTDYWQDGSEYEGVYLQEVQTELNSVQKEIPAGSYVVLMHQAGSGMAVEVLEPEAPNSFVSFEQVPTELGATLPYYRISTSTELPEEIRVRHD